MQVRQELNNNTINSGFTLKMKNVFATIKNCFSLTANPQNSAMNIQRQKKHPGILDKIKSKFFSEIPLEKQQQKGYGQKLFKIPVIKKVQKQQKIKRKSRNRIANQRQHSQSSSSDSSPDDIFSSEQSFQQIRQLPPKKDMIPISQNSSIAKKKRMVQNSIQSGYSLVEDIQQGQNMIDLSYSSDSGDMGQIDDMNPDFQESEIEQNPSRKNLDFKKVKTNAFKNLAQKLTEDKHNKPFVGQRQNSYLFYRRYQTQVTKYEKIRQLYQKHKKYLEQRSKKEQQFNIISKKKSQILQTKGSQNRYQKDSKLIQRNIKGIFNNLKTCKLSENSNSQQKEKSIKQDIKAPQIVQVEKKPLFSFGIINSQMNTQKPQETKQPKVNLFTGNRLPQTSSEFIFFNNNKPQLNVAVSKQQKQQKVQKQEPKTIFNKEIQKKSQTVEQTKPIAKQSEKKEQVVSSTLNNNQFTPKKESSSVTSEEKNPFKSGFKTTGLDFQSLIKQSTFSSDNKLLIDPKWEQNNNVVPNPPLLSTPQSSKKYQGSQNPTPMDNSMQDQSQEHSEVNVNNEPQQQTTPFQNMNKPPQQVSWFSNNTLGNTFGIANSSPSQVRTSFMDPNFSTNPANSLKLFLNEPSNPSQSLFSQDSFNENRPTGRKNKKKDAPRIA